jgi:hypothetical protein
MKELFRISTMLEGPGLLKLGKLKLPKVLVEELTNLTKKASKVLDTWLDEEIHDSKKAIAKKEK